MRTQVCERPNIEMPTYPRSTSFRPPSIRRILPL